MYLRPWYKKEGDQRKAYWALVESHRTVRGPRQRVVAYWGQVEQKQRIGVRQAAEGAGRSRQRRLFDVKVQAEADGQAKLIWSKVEAWRNWAEISEGCYVLRSNITDWPADQLWKAYMQLTEAESAFRIQKHDLKIRPIWHQRADRVQAHILVCFLTYVLWKTLGQWCKRAGLGHEPRKVFDELARIKAVDVILPTRCGQEIRRRCITRPTAHQAILLQHLGLSLPTRLKVADSCAPECSEKNSPLRTKTKHLRA